jgi:hypothetical protein
MKTVLKDAFVDRSIEAGIKAGPRCFRTPGNAVQRARRHPQACRGMQRRRADHGLVQARTNCCFP